MLKGPRNEGRQRNDPSLPGNVSGAISAYVKDRPAAVDAANPPIKIICVAYFATALVLSLIVAQMLGPSSTTQVDDRSATDSRRFADDSGHATEYASYHVFIDANQ